MLRDAIGTYMYCRREGRIERKHDVDIISSVHIHSIETEDSFSPPYKTELIFVGVVGIPGSVGTRHVIPGLLQLG